MSHFLGTLAQRIALRNERLKRFAAREPAVAVSLALGGIGIFMPLIVLPIRSFLGSKRPEALPPPPRAYFTLKLLLSPRRRLHVNGRTTL